MNEFIFQSTAGKYHKFPQVYSDLELDNIADKVDRTITVFGRDKLKHRLSYVISDPSDLQQLVDLNQTIAIDDGYRERMTRHLLNIKKVESNVVRWMKSHPDDVTENDENENENKDGFSDGIEGGLNKNSDSDLYFKKGTSYNPYNIMNNRVALTASNRFVMSSVLIIIIIYVIIYLYLYYYGFPMSITDYIYGIYQGYVMFCRFLLMQLMSNLDWIEMGAVILALTYVSYQIYNSYKSAMICYEHYCLCSDFIDRYNKMCDFIDAVSQLYDADRYVRDLTEDDSMSQSIEYLKSYFTKGSSLGYSLVSQISSLDYVKHMNSVVNYVGKVDMLVSLSSLLKEGFTLPIIQHKRRSPMFHYDFPTLSAVGVWNPMLGLKKSIRNSLRVDSTLPNVVILTGPNKAGKSTFVKSLLLTVYMAQSIGLCSADTLVFTPFRDLFTYLNVPDSIGRESLFEAEVNRCYDYLKKCEELRGFSLGIIDELFTGTNPAEGMAGSYAILNQIAKNPVNITIISTHFHDMLKELDRSYFSFKKFTCDTMIDVFGGTRHRFDYRLKNGVSNQMIALSLLEEKGFDDQTVANAHKFIQKLKAQKVRALRSESEKEENVEKDKKKRYLPEMADELMDEVDVESIDIEDIDASDIDIKAESNKDHLAVQYARALEYSKNYNVSNGLPAILRR
jgi:MutS domain V